VKWPTVGRITQVIGAVVDVQFDGHLPRDPERAGNRQQRPAPGAGGCAASRRNTVRTIAMDTTEGLVRGQRSSTPASRSRFRSATARLGRIMNVIGEPVDEPARSRPRRSAASTSRPRRFVDQSTEAEILVTGIKVVDLLAPYAKGGKIGLFGGAGVGKTVSSWS
jgi:F-type H+-transporting ATPase subunit beta